MISPRCVAPVCCAFGLAAGLLAQRTFAHRPSAAPYLITFLICWVFVRETACAAILLQQRQAFLALTAGILNANRNPDAPILVGDSALVLPSTSTRQTPSAAASSSPSTSPPSTVSNPTTPASKTSGLAATESSPSPSFLSRLCHLSSPAPWSSHALAAG